MRRISWERSRRRRLDKVVGRVRGGIAIWSIVRARIERCALL